MLLRYHGSFPAEPAAPPKHSKPDHSLRDALGRLIAQHGLVFLGYSLAEMQLAQLLRETTRSWFVDPITSAEEINSVFEIGRERCVTGEDALPDNFLQGLCSVLLKEEVSGRLLMGPGTSFSKHRGRIDKFVEEIVMRLKADSLDDREVEYLTGKLLEDI